MAMKQGIRKRNLHALVNTDGIRDELGLVKTALVVNKAETMGGGAPTSSLTVATPTSARDSSISSETQAWLLGAQPQKIELDF